MPPVLARAALAVALIAPVLAGSSAAQSILRGRVVADSGKRPIVGAEIALGSPPRLARTDAAGRFSLGDLTAGTVAIRVRAVGFKPLDIEATIGPHDTADVEFSLSAAPQQLPTLVVKEKPPPPFSAKMEVFEQRRRLGFGTFLSRAELVKWQDQPASITIRRIANLRLIARPPECGGGFAAASGRSGQMRPQCGGYLLPYACYMAIYLDGMQWWVPGFSGDPPPDIDQFRVDQLQGMEVYRGPGELPAELQQTGSICGAVVLWTRTGETEAQPRPAAARRPAQDSTKRSP
jgi:hypothetical protein